MKKLLEAEMRDRFNRVAHVELGTKEDVLATNELVKLYETYLQEKKDKMDFYSEIFKSVCTLGAAGIAAGTSLVLSKRIMTFEKEDVIVSKAFGLIPKLKFF